MVQKVAPFTVKLLRKRWFPPFSTSLFQAFRSRGDSAKRYEEKKSNEGWGPCFPPCFFLALFLRATLHYPNAWNKLFLNELAQKCLLYRL